MFKRRLINIPKYQTIAGQFFSNGSLGKDDFWLRIQNTTVEECREYARILEEVDICWRLLGMPF